MTARRPKTPARNPKTTKRLILAKETLRDLKPSEPNAREIKGGWPTGGGLDSQCSARHSGCI